MIVFDRIRFMNFMSFGNAWTEIELGKTRTTLVVGVNGAGKSSGLLDSLYFALFGRPYREVNKPQLVNTITGKSTLVELEFRTPQYSYLVRRGLKPNLFEVHRDGKLVDPPASVTDYQDWFESSVLRFNAKMFKQVVVLGSATYVPFMQLPAHERRAVIEGLLDIGVFSKMNLLLRERVDANRTALAAVEQDRREVAALIEQNDRLVARAREDAHALAQQRRETIDQVRAELDELATAAARLMDEARAKRSGTEELPGLKSARDARASHLHVLKTRVSEVATQLAFLDHTETCPTCKQAIDEEFKTARAAELAHARESYLEEARAAGAQVEQAGVEIARLEAVLAEAARLESEVARMGAQAREKMRFIEHLTDEIEKLERRSEVATVGDDARRELEERRDRVEARWSELLRDQQVLDAAGVLLKDGGIKAQVIKQYVPTLNALIAKYLAALDFYCEFALDENFKETIRSRYRDTFTYESFSEGEKCRINLALLFAWRDVARFRNSVRCNITIMDEILDGSMDAMGADEFIKILGQLTDGESVFVISHRRDNLIDKFDRALEFVKVGNFSRLEEAA